MFERFTKSARESVKRAHSEAEGLHQHTIGTEHLLLALAHPDGGIAHTVLHQAGLDQATITAAIGRHLAARKPLSEQDAAALRTVGIDLDAVIAQVEDSFGPGAMDAPLGPARRSLFGRRRDGTGSLGIRPHGLSPKASKAIELALREAIRCKHNYIGTEHLLLGLLRGGDGLAAKIITDTGVRLEDLRDSTIAALEQAA